ncbi:MAG: PLP-dependent aminotransferase family protein [Chloroflexales bacterium]|nr:PLP-dependent aminotransferase family protein [Chloroflexales bacterium]
MSSTRSPYQLSDLFTARTRTLIPPLFGAVTTAGPELISLEYGLADPTCFPRDDLLAATATVLAEDIESLNYAPTSMDLVAQILARLQAQGIAAERDTLLVGYGSSQILGLLPGLLVEPGDVVLIEGPSFLGAVHQFATAGARLITIPTDADGIDVEALEAMLIELQREGIRPRFVYTIPTFHNPTGATLSLERRKKLVALGAAYGVLIVEDDAYVDLRFEGAPLPSLAALDSEGWVIRVGTFSKILAPGLRVGWAHAHPDIRGRLAMLKAEGSTGSFLTQLVARYCADGRLERHIEALNVHYRRKRDVMLAAIDREFPEDVQVTRPAGGFFVWCKLPPDISATDLLPYAEARGVTFLPGTSCFADGQGDDGIRLAFSYQPAEKIATGITLLGAAMRDLREK